MENELIKLKEIINEIEDVNKETIIEAEKRMISLAKPPNSLGKLEDISIKLAGITGKVKNTINKKLVIIMCSDNGLVEEGVASSPQSVTLAQTINSVSYTHLKANPKLIIAVPVGFVGAAESKENMDELNIPYIRVRAVSYTHLDVYKRQDMEIS